MTCQMCNTDGFFISGVAVTWVSLQTLNVSKQQEKEL